APEPDGIDEVGGSAPLTLAGQLSLVGIDARAVILTVDSGNVIERVVLGDREPKKPLPEYIGAAERFPAVAERRVWLFAIERAGLRRVWEVRRVRREEIRIARNAIIVGAAPERIGVHRDIAGAPIEQHRAFEPVVDALHGRARLDIEAAGYVRGRRNGL